jgi:hypothetical protein
MEKNHHQGYYTICVKPGSLLELFPYNGFKTTVDYDTILSFISSFI